MESRQDSGFDSLLRTAISEGMETVLGAGGAKAIFYHLGLPNLDNPGKFHEKLNTIFGVGTTSLERVIIQQLHQAMGVRPSEGGGDDFVKQVERAKRHYETAAALDRRH